MGDVDGNDGWIWMAIWQLYGNWNNEISLKEVKMTQGHMLKLNANINSREEDYYQDSMPMHLWFKMYM